MRDDKPTAQATECEQLRWAVALKAARAIRAINEIELCKRTIAQYEELGLSGTTHDVEHRQMMSSAIEDLKKAMP